MTIRRKLLALLGIVAVLPMLLTSVLDVDVIRSLSRDLTARSAGVLAEQALATMNRIAGEYADALDRESRRVRLLVDLQADAAARALAAPPPAGSVTPWFDHDFDRGSAGLELTASPAPRAARERRYGPPLAVSWSQVALHAAAGADVNAADARALASLAPFLRLVRDPGDDVLGWQYVVLANGLSASYPGHGGNPAGFDPRERPWFEQQMQAPAFRWYRPHYDASTGALLINATAPVRDAAGKVIGVTGVDVDLSATFDLLRLPADLRAGSRVMEVAVVGAPLFEPPRAMVLARQRAAGNGDWHALPRLAEFELDDAAATQAVREDMLRGAEGHLRAVLDGADSFVLYRRFGEAGAYVVMTVPVASAARAAVEAARYAADTTRTHVHGLLVLVLAITAVAGLVAIAVSHHLTRPVRDLLAATARLAEGDYGARARVTTRDELGALAQAFNAMVPRLAAHAEVEKALALAREVQQQLLPAQPPTLRGYDICGTTLYSEQTGGDFFDYLEVATPHGPALAVIVADVSGHGVGPALLMATTRALLHGARDRGLAPGRLLAQVNRDLIDDVSRGHFVTLFLLVLEPAGGALEWASAGHDPALVWDAGHNTVCEIGGDDIPLGIDAEWDYAGHGGRALACGDILVIGTDGVWDTRRADGERYGKQRLQAYVAAHAADGAAALCRGLERELAAFRGRAPQTDDITVVVIKRTRD